VSPHRPPATGPVVSAGPRVPVELTLTGPPGLDRPAGRRPASRRPPRHLADLPLAERRAAVTELGEPPFRASQLSRHYFGRYTDRADEMTDLPRTSREALARALLPPLLTAER